MRFRKRVKVFPGFYLNFSNSGVSSTLGVKGASINFSKRGTYLNYSIPGTGLYSRQRIWNNPEGLNDIDFRENPSFRSDYLQRNIPGEIKSANADRLTSASLIELKETLEEVYKDRIELGNEIRWAKAKISAAKATRTIACIFLIGFLIKSLKRNILEKQNYLIDLEDQLTNSVIDVDMHFDETFQEKYSIVINKYKALLNSEIIWDITSSVSQDMKITRSAASTVVTRVPVNFKFDNIDIIKSSYQAFHFENKNGGDLYIYPAFAVVTNNKRQFGLIDIKDFDLIFSIQHFLEEGKIPSDSMVISKTWAKVNKNGTPDKRFSNNYEIPIVKYGQFEVKSNSGLNEAYAFSNYEKSEEFASAFTEYKDLIC